MSGMRPDLSDRARWPMYSQEHSNRSQSVAHDNLAVPGLDQQGSQTGWSAYFGVVQPQPITLQPAYGTFYDSTPNLTLGGWRGPGQLGNWGGIVNILTLDPARQGEGTPGRAPVMSTGPSPSMDFKQGPTFGDVAYKIPAGP